MPLRARTREGGTGGWGVSGGARVGHGWWWGARPAAGVLCVLSCGTRLGEWPRDRREEEEEDAHEVDGLRAGGEPVARADRLRDDLTEDEDEGRREGGAHDAAGERRRQDRDPGVDERVAEEQCAEEQVGALAHWHDALGLPTLDRVAPRDLQLQLTQVERHQPERQPGEHAGEDQQPARG